MMMKDMLCSSIRVSPGENTNFPLIHRKNNQQSSLAIKNGNTNKNKAILNVKKTTINIIVPPESFEE